MLSLFLYLYLSIDYMHSYITDSKSERPGDINYVPRDEMFGHLKQSDFIGFGIKAVNQNVIPGFHKLFDRDNEFHSFEEVRSIFEGGVKLPTDMISSITPIPVLKEILRTDGEQFLKFPPPKVIQGLLINMLHMHISNLNPFCLCKKKNIFKQRIISMTTRLGTSS